MIKTCWSRLIGNYTYTDNEDNICYIHGWLFNGTQEDWDRTLYCSITAVIDRFFKLNFASECIINQWYQSPPRKLLFGPNNESRLSLRAFTSVQPFIEEYEKSQRYASNFTVNIIECNRGSFDVIDILYDDEVMGQITLLDLFDLHLERLD